MRILDELGDELVRAARAQETRAAAGGRRRALADRLPATRPLPRAVVISLASLLVLAAVAVAATLVIDRGDPIPAAPPGAVPREQQPVPGTARLNGLGVADPDGGPSWDVRTSRSRTGLVCATVGQLLDGDLGLVGLDHRFHALPAGAADTCSAPQAHGATLAGARAFRGGSGLHPITVVSGVVAPAVSKAVASATGAKDIIMKIGPGGAFLAIFDGTPEQRRPRVTLTEADGKTTILRFADTGEYLTPDSGGGTPWTIQRITYNTAPGLRCIAVQREHGPDSPPPGAMTGIMTATTPVRCAPDGTAFASVRRFSPVRRQQWGGYYWDVNPSRTMVWGAVAHAGATVRVSAAGVPERDLAVDAKTLGYAAALDGKIDPASVRVTVDGRPLTPNAGVRDKRGKILPPPVQPPWRSVASAGSLRVGAPLRPEPATAQVTRRVADPTGGPAWSLRTWIAHVPSQQRVVGSSRTLRCFQVGVARGGQLILPLGAGRTRTLGLQEADGYCGDAHGDRAIGAYVTRVPVDDVTAADPRPQRVILAGVAAPDVRSAQLLGLGGDTARRRVPLAADGSWLVVLPPSALDRRLRLRTVRTDGRTGTTSLLDGGANPCGVSPADAMRVADPDGGPPWATGSRRTGRSCSFVSRIVDGHYGYVDEDDGTVDFGPSFWSGGGAPLGDGQPVFLQTQPMTSPLKRTATPTAPSRQQVVRRTLPGRTVVYGVVAPDVVSVTLRTPRDIRTIKPQAGAFLAVYDGSFYGGEIVATAHLRDGRAVDVTQPASFLPPLS